ncbi:magnesium transporter NIPA-domain-containing protein [Elsinoe ampelina]|uniref:Magnesium transporter NIPA-domain-containing protein n=1 Tax=Elsinoe ampelina TaxID=302913 RepID=A0A6A6GAY2_9PEZI|nr:magnesium transporter NIPA-domain-containing protein [Elsinoe ampelina]
MVEDKYIGLSLAVTSTLAIGSSFVITKKGLIDANERHGFEGDGFSYLKSPIWWGGIITMVIGEIANFAAYAFAPAILVTPLGALSVLIGAVLGAYFLGERLGTLGKLGCATCLIGSVVIVLHAPPDKDVQTIDEILNYAIQPGFLFYGLFVIVFATVMIYFVAPKYGRKNPLIYLSICSTVGSISICAVKGLGIALKLTFAGSNQLTHPSTYVFLIVTIVAIMTQMNYFNKALSQFSTNIVNPLYYVTFTTCTLLASFILFQGFNTTDTVNTISLLCGFLVIFSGVYLLNLSRDDPDGRKNMLAAGNSRYEIDGIPTDAMAAPLTRRSMQARRSGDSHSRSGSLNFGSPDDRRKIQERLMHNYDVERASEDRYGLSDLAEDEEDDDASGGSGKKRTSFDRAGLAANGRLSGAGARRMNGGKLLDLEDGKESPKRKSSRDSRR